MSNLKHSQFLVPVIVVICVLVAGWLIRHNANQASLVDAWDQIALHVPPSQDQGIVPEQVPPTTTLLSQQNPAASSATQPPVTSQLAGQRQFNETPQSVSAMTPPAQAESVPDGWVKNRFYNPDQMVHQSALSGESVAATVTRTTDMNVPEGLPTDVAADSKSAPKSVLQSSIAQPVSNSNRFASLALPMESDDWIPKSVTGERNKLPTSLPLVEVGMIPEGVLHEAVHHIEYGKSLARRGSAFAARQEFINGLRLMAQAADAHTRTTNYTQSLNDALIALQEAEDFYVGDTEVQLTQSVETASDGHQTQAFSTAEAKTMTPIVAMQRYFSLAELKLFEAGGLNVVSAEALYSMGKLHSAMASQPNSDPLNIAKSIVFHRSALACDRNHFRCANELGALMAKTGRLQEAKSLLLQSLRIQQMATTWKNLATIHERLAASQQLPAPQRAEERQLANAAFREYELALQQPSSPDGRGKIQWKTPQEFNEQAPAEVHEAIARRSDEQSAPAQKTWPFPRKKSSQGTGVY